MWTSPQPSSNNLPITKQIKIFVFDRIKHWVWQNCWENETQTTPKLETNKRNSLLKFNQILTTQQTSLWRLNKIQPSINTLLFLKGWEQVIVQLTLHNITQNWAIPKTVKIAMKSRAKKEQPQKNNMTLAKALAKFLSKTKLNHLFLWKHNQQKKSKTVPTKSPNHNNQQKNNPILLQHKIIDNQHFYPKTNKL